VLFLKYVNTKIYSDDQSVIECIGCKTRWTPKLFLVNNVYEICPNCDTWCQRFLCNPVNFKSVLKYIDFKYHKYLLPDDLHYCKGCYDLDLDINNTCKWCEMVLKC